MIRYIYLIIRFIILFIIYTSTILIFFLEKPSYLFNTFKKPLAYVDISVSSFEGNLFDGLDIKDINYKDRLKLDRFKLKIDWSALEHKIFKIDDLRIKNLYVQEEFLASLLDKNSSDSSDKDMVIPMDIDRFILKNCEFSLADTKYRDGEIGDFNFNLKNLDIDLDLNSSTIVDEISLDDLNLSIDRLAYKAYKLNYMKLNSHNLLLKLDHNISNVVKILKFDIFDLDVSDIIYDKFQLKYAKALLGKSYFKTFKNININSGNMEVDGFKYLDYNLKYSKLNIDDLEINFDENFSISNIYTKDTNLLIERGKYRDYFVKSSDLNLKGARGNLEDYRGDVSLKLNSNVVNGDIQGFIKNSYIDLKGYIKPKRGYLEKFIDDGSGIKINRDITIKVLKLKGDYKDSLDFILNLKDISLRKDIYRLGSKKLLASGKYGIKDSSLFLKLDTIINSNLGKIYLIGNTSLNFNDLNRTLKYDINSRINLDKQFISQYIDGISIEKLNSIKLKLKGDIENTKYRIYTKNISILKDDIYIDTPINLDGNLSISMGNVNFNLLTKPLSNIGYGALSSRGSLNFKSFKSTFKYYADFEIFPDKNYLNNILSEQNITLVKNPFLSGMLEGGISSVDAILDSEVKFLYQKHILDLSLGIPDLYFNFNSLDIFGNAKLFSKSYDINFRFLSKFSGNLNDIENITLNSNLNIKKFKGFGVNLNPILPMNIDLNIKNRLADFKLKSKRLNINGTSQNFDTISLKIKSKKLYLYKFISLPQELEHKYVALDLSLDAEVSSKYVNLRGYIFSNKKFKSYIKVLNSKRGKLHANVDINHLQLNIDGDIDKKDIVAKLNIDSISGFQKEISKVYNFDIVNIDGKLSSNLILNGETGLLKVSSPKLELNGFNIEDINFDANYRDKLITLNTLTWKVSGFDNKKFNRKFYLKQKGKIFLGNNKYIDIQISPDITIEAKESENGLNGELNMYKIPIAHPDYGSLFLSCNIFYNKFEDEQTISGDITLKDMQISYETKFLEADYDPDIVVVTKRKKKMIKEKLKEDNFLRNTKIDISLSASHASYYTPDINLFFDVDLNIYKEFGRNLTLLGRVEDINGYFDQTPKRFLVRNSNIVFQGGEEINPLLDIKVEYELPQVLIEIYVGGYANKPKINFSSEPPMPKKDIMSYLLFGTSTKKLTDGQDSISREAELFILNQLARDFAYEFKLDRLFIKADETGDGYAVEAGKKVGKSSMIIIEGSRSGSSYIFEKDINKNLKLRIGEHIKEYRSQSIDIFYRKRFK